MQKPRSFLYTWPQADLHNTISDHFHALLARRACGEPIAYILRKQMFWSLELAISPAVLIPRPDTETLIETALALDLPPCARVLDLGTGSGAIALALAHERPDWQFTATDNSASALQIAKQNQRQLSLTNVTLLHSDWFTALSGERFDLIISNPPYIAEHDVHLAQGDLRFEPRTALTAGADGQDAIRHIVANAGAYLTEQGSLLLEHGFDQAEAVQQLLKQHSFTGVESVQDLAGHARVTLGTNGKSP